MERASVFKNNKSQAIRLPKRVTMPPDVRQVDIVALGRTRLIVPAGTAWESWFAEEPVTPDFMADRDQPDDQDRDPFAQ